MLKNTLSIGDYMKMESANYSTLVPSKPKLSVAKIKKKFEDYFSIHKKEREASDENKANLPRMHQSVRNTAWELIYYYVKNWGKPIAKNAEIRITYSYLRRALGESCCIATLKNHVNKLLAMSGGFIKEKLRGGLGLPLQNTACIVLVLDQDLLIFEDERHNQAMKEGQLSALETPIKAAEAEQNRNKALNEAHASIERLGVNSEGRKSTPTAIGTIFSDNFGPAPKVE